MISSWIVWSALSMIFVFSLDNLLLSLLESKLYFRLYCLHNFYDLTWIAKLCFGQFSYFSKTFKFWVTVCLFHSGRLLEWRTRRLRTGKASLPLWNAQEQNTWIYARSWWTPRQMRQSGFSGAIASKRWARYQPISLSTQCVKYKKNIHLT